jgi:hypothetical protein
MTSVASQSVLGDLAACVARMDFGRALKRELLMESQPAILYAQPLNDAVTLFERLGIGYALAGGMAAMFYGRARFTEDVDFVAASGHRDVLAANPQIMRECHFDPGCTWKLYHESGTDIDIWKDDCADDIVRRAVTVKMAGRDIRIAELHDLIAMKLRAGRLQDDFDISEIVKHHVIDTELLESYVTPEKFAHLREIIARG